MIIEQKSPMTAKMKGKPHRHESRRDWDRVRTKIMRWCLRVKLVQNCVKFADLLLETGNKPIVEESKKDDFWGAKPLDDGTLKGRNVLGRLLMELREELLSQNRQAYERIAPLKIPDFNLFGSAIDAVMAPKEKESEKSEFQDAPLFSQPPLPGLSAEEPALERAGSPNAARIVMGINESTKNTGSINSIPKECKRLAEVDFPVAQVSDYSVRENNVRHGHPKNIHWWRARRPLAACRAMILALAFPDPIDPYCPRAFKEQAIKLLSRLPGRVGTTDQDLQHALLRFIADFAQWDLAREPAYLEVARELVSAAHPDEPPLVVDPFAGGGAIPLEALRTGCDAFASDLNPVSSLILKVMLEDLPRQGAGFQHDLRVAFDRLISDVRLDLREVYPTDPDGAQPITYLWARTVTCESPSCGAEIPLIRSFWLSKKANRRIALYYKIVERNSDVPLIDLEIISPRTDGEVPQPTIRGGKATCPACNTSLSSNRVMSQLTAQKGGANIVFDEQGQRTHGARLLAVATLKPGNIGRHYRLAQSHDYVALVRAEERLRSFKEDLSEGSLSITPDEPINPIRPSPNARGLSAPTRYGILTFADLFTRRQLLSLITLTREVRILNEAHAEILCLALCKLTDLANSMTRWEPIAECPRQMFSRQAISMTWDFTEGVPISNSSASFETCFDGLLDGLRSLDFKYSSSSPQMADAANSPLPDDSAAIWFTDPPYYDAIPYADLSDFFFVWLKRTLPENRFVNSPLVSVDLLTPKNEECVWNRAHKICGKPKDGHFFEETIAKCFLEGKRVLKDDGIGCVVFAHKTTEGWEALLSGLIQGGWVITSSWPIETETTNRLTARNTASLATSVHLVCRPRAGDAAVGDWSDVLQRLPVRVGDWMERLQSEGVRGADLVFACIGPALEIFSRHSRVETAEGREVGLPEYLEKVWEVVGRRALEQVLGTAEAQARNGLAGALEEDARLTALFLWTLQSTNGGAESNGADDSEEEDEAPRGKSKGYSLMFDVARRFAQPLGIRLPDWEGQIIETSKGVVRLMAVTERGKQLFGESGAGTLADEIEVSPLAAAQLTLFPEETPTVRGSGRQRGRTASVAAGNLEASLEATTLDRVHAAMLLQASGRSQALRNLLKAEQERGPDFLRLANALSALYPRGSEEKRLLDAMLLAVPR